MAQSTTIKNAKALVCNANSQDISGSISGVDLTLTIENSTFFTADGDYSLALSGKRSGSGVINAFYSETSNEAEDVLSAAFHSGDTISVVITPLGSTSGNKTWTFNALVTSLPMSLDAGAADPIGIAAPFITSGTVTEGTVA